MSPTAEAVRPPSRAGSTAAGSTAAVDGWGRPASPAASAGDLVAARRPRASALGTDLAARIAEPDRLAQALNRALAELADPACLAGLAFVAPGIGPAFGVRSGLQRALERAFARATRRDSPATLLVAADRLLAEDRLEARWFAFGLLDRTLEREPERTWQLLRRAGRDAADWITVDRLAHVAARGILLEPYRWAELEQLVFAPSRWERRLVGSTIATLPFADRRAGRRPEVATRALPILGQLIGDAEPDVQKALAWAYRSMAGVDPAATAAALAAETAEAVATADGHRARVIRDALSKLDPVDADRLRPRLGGIRRRPGAAATSRAAETAARFADLGLGRRPAEPPLT